MHRIEFIQKCIFIFLSHTAHYSNFEHTVLLKQLFQSLWHYWSGFPPQFPCVWYILWCLSLLSHYIMLQGLPLVCKAKAFRLLCTSAELCNNILFIAIQLSGQRCKQNMKKDVTFYGGKSAGSCTSDHTLKYFKHLLHKMKTIRLKDPGWNICLFTRQTKVSTKPTRVESNPLCRCPMQVSSSWCVFQGYWIVLH